MSIKRIECKSRQQSVMILPPSFTKLDKHLSDYIVDIIVLSLNYSRQRSLQSRIDCVHKRLKVIEEVVLSEEER